MESQSSPYTRREDFMHGRETEHHELEEQREEDQDEEEMRRLEFWRLTSPGAPPCVDELTQKLTTVRALEHSARYRPNTRRSSLPLVQSHSTPDRRRSITIAVPKVHWPGNWTATVVA